MSVSLKKNYIFIAGAWHGGWVWKNIANKLREQNHNVTTLTLTGIGEKQHNITNNTNLSTHIEDVLAHIQMEELDDVVLVGWSYGGMVVTGVASRIPDKIKALYYLDAALPEPGKSLSDYLPLPIRQFIHTQLQISNQISPAPMSSFGLTDPDDLAFVNAHVTPHPIKSLIEPLPDVNLPDVPITYVYCSGYGKAGDEVADTYEKTWERVRHDPRIRGIELNCNHFPMLSEPEKTLDILLDKY
ncbi:hypothetical protein ED28_01030 [[Pantoea] beijingensis]|uniref:AB hydrolase-1 domain-containing protein n=1 Tax=[Pantoea] beijingensis TaxID=1324864 RepID=A0A443IHV5_9GAMM|nr:alpha/beta hydrolase [[Pantoea] beijingensis]RWR03599.1 hypothetical protein ED28_01030 [[Pantoea] beijingensis]